MGNTKHDLREPTLIDVVTYDGKPAIRSISTRRKDSKKVATEDHVEYLKFNDLEAGIAIGEQLAAACREMIALSAETEKAAED